MYICENNMTMKKLFTITLAVVFSSLIQAQPTLNGNDVLYSAGQTYAVHFGTQSGLSAGSSGTGVTWDFSTISCPTNQSVSLLATAGQPGASNFPSANLTMTDANIYSYEFTDNTSWIRLGAYQISSSTAITFTNSEKLIEFPISFNDTQTDAFSGSSVPSGINRGGDVTSQYDGFGTLILPYGIISNVIRIHVSEDYSDEIVSYGMTIDYITDVYMFFKQGINYPLLAITSFTSSSSGSTQYATYLDQSHVGISEQGTLAGFSLYPNPANDFVMAEFESDAAGIAEIRITDMSGKLISISQSEIDGAGLQNIMLDVSNFQTGLYIVSVSIGDNTSYIKLNVE